MNKDDHPLVSIVTPAYNQGDYIAETIESVLAQDYPSIEYLVLDDGSTDHTREVLERYSGRVSWESHANMGQSATLNKGWVRASGKYLAYISADDRLLPHAVSTLVKSMEERPEVVTAYCDFDFIDANGQKCGTAASPDWDYRRMTEELICHPGPGALFRRDAYLRAGGWNPTLRRVPDFEFWLRMGRLGPFMRVPQVLAESRLHAESTGLRPIPYDRSMEIVNTMAAYWGADKSAGAKLALSRAHHKAAVSHAQSGRILAALTNYAHAIRYRPRMLIAARGWLALFRGYALRWGRHDGKAAVKLR